MIIIKRENTISLEPLKWTFSICKVMDYSGIDIERPFVFSGSTDREKSVICPLEMIPSNAIAREDGWKAFRVCGELDFSLIGILAGISEILADAKIGIFVISTYNTDYVFTKENVFEDAIRVLKDAGYHIMQ